jgi:hypothetical protein
MELEMLDKMLPKGTVVINCRDIVICDVAINVEDDPDEEGGEQDDHDQLGDLESVNQDKCPHNLAVVLNDVVGDQGVLATLLHPDPVIVIELLNEYFVREHLNRLEDTNGLEEVEQAAILEFKHGRVGDQREDIKDKLAMQVVQRDPFKAPHWLRVLIWLVLLEKISKHVDEEDRLEGILKGCRLRDLFWSQP